MEPGFIDMLIGNFDPYFESNILYYLNSMVQYPPTSIVIQNNTSLYSVLLADAKCIIAKLNEYFPDDVIILGEQENMTNTIRDKIMEYVWKNGTHF